MVNTYYFIKLLIMINSFIFILGIKGKSILFELSSIIFPRSFPVDIMHLFFENIAPQMFKLWSSRFFTKDDNLNATPFAISRSSWNTIGVLMQNNKKKIPKTRKTRKTFQKPTFNGLTAPN